MHLSNQLQTLTKGSLSILAYYERKWALPDSLLKCTVVILDVDLISYIIYGLGFAYGSFRVALSMQDIEISSNELLNLLQEKQRLEEEARESLIPSPTSNMASRGAPHDGINFGSRSDAHLMTALVMIALVMPSLVLFGNELAIRHQKTKAPDSYKEENIYFIKKYLNDLVYVKYNRTLFKRYEMRDRIDPISLDEIDESNEWLTRRHLDDVEDELVYEDDESLIWGLVVEASGANGKIFC